MGWKEISKKIENANEQVCKRRYFRIKSERKKWPKELDARVRILFEVEKKDWKEIMQIIKKEFQITKREKLLKLEKRYLVALNSRISR